MNKLKAISILMIALIIITALFTLAVNTAITTDTNTDTTTDTNNKIIEINNLINEWNSEVKNSRIIAKTIYNKSNKYNIDRRLVLAIAIQESDFRQNVTGKAGEIGIMQVKPGTGKDVQNKNEVLNLSNIKDNITAGIRYLKLCKNLVGLYTNDYKELLRLTATAYNRGPWIVRKELNQGKNPVNNYAKEVLELRHLILIGQL